MRKLFLLCCLLAFSLPAASGSDCPGRRKDNDCFGRYRVNCEGACPKQVTCYRVVKTGVGKYRLDISLRNAMDAAIEFDRACGRDKLRMKESVNATKVNTDIIDNRSGSILFSVADESQPVTINFAIDFTASNLVAVTDKARRPGSITFQPDTSADSLPRVMPHQNNTDCQLMVTNKDGSNTFSGYCDVTNFPLAP